ncbi:MAG: helix-hairpin-helix domain-containing protein [Pirellulaceae bacterium]|nr:helix-hairpin-helix domain-containing protein [Pirellulaceae bacterium]
MTRHVGGWIVLGAGLLLVCSRSVWHDTSSPGDVPGPLDARLYPALGIDINQASAAELGCIPGVGPALATRIIHHRETYGPFQTSADLQKGPGVGPSLAAQLNLAIQPLTPPLDQPVVALGLPTSLTADKTAND